MSVSLGECIYIALKPIFKIYLIMGTGFLLVKTDNLSLETTRGMSNLIINAILPCLAFNKIVANISDRDIKTIGVIVLSCVILFTLGFAGAFAANYVTPVPKKWYYGILFTGIFPNISDLPIAYMQSLGTTGLFSTAEVEKGVAYACVFMSVQNFMLMNLGMFRMIGFDIDVTDEAQEGEEVDLEDKNNSIDREHFQLAKNNFEQTRSLEELVGEHYNIGDLTTKKSMDLGDQSLEQKGLNKSSDTYTKTHKDELTKGKDSQDHAEEEEIEMESLDSLKSYTHNDVYHVQSFELKTEPQKTEKIRRNSNVQYQPNSNCESFQVVRKRSRRNGSISSSANAQSLNGDKPYLSPLGRKKSLIDEYSEQDRISRGDLDLTKPMQLTGDVPIANRGVFLQERVLVDPVSGENRIYTIASKRSLAKICVEEKKDDLESGSCDIDMQSLSNDSEKSKSKIDRLENWFARHKMNWIWYVLVNCQRPASVGTILGFVVAMIPWVKALFVHTYVHVHQAPDKQPVLNFIMDFTSYVAQACVPLGLLMLGATIGRLEVKNLQPGFWKSAMWMTFVRLILMPIIGILWTNRIYNIDWIDTRIAKFVIILTFAMPSATAQVYFTAFFSPIEGDHLQMDCLSVCILMQYSVLFVSLAFVLSYALKVDLKF
ncbi:hypothetical protein ACO0RG_002602 [Hanseniaspora osmophila]